MLVHRVNLIPTVVDVNCLHTFYSLQVNLVQIFSLGGTTTKVESSLCRSGCVRLQGQRFEQNLAQKEAKLMADKIKAFFQKKVKDKQFKNAGKGHR